MKKNILITGGFGYVGSRLTPLLLEQGHTVRVLDLNLYGDDGLTALQKHAQWPQFQKRFQFFRADLRNAEAVSEALKGVEAVIHLAAISNDPTGEIDEILTRQVNFDAMGVLLGLARQAGVKRLINASSSSVFGIKNEENVTEALEPEPLTFYSKYKMLSEWVVSAAASADFCTVNIRPATICGYSPRQRFDLTVNKLTADGVTKKLITVHGGQQRRPNIGITDVINLYSTLLDVPAEKINGRTFNFGFENLKVIEIANTIRDELSDLGVEIKVTDTTDLRDYHINSQKIVEALGCKPVSSIRQEVNNLRKMLESGHFANIEDSKHYNMKSMNIARNPSCYKYLNK